MGPEATILLQQRLLQTVAARDDADHLPLLIDMNPHVPSRIAHLIEGGGANPGPTLAEMAGRLVGAGATALAMPCNTAHHYAPFITEASAVPLLNMVDLSLDVAARHLLRGSKVGILASPAVKLAGVFDAPLNVTGLSALWPKNTNRMLDAIKMVKATGPVPEAREILSKAAEDLCRNGADLLIVACSEFSLMAGDLNASVPIIDTVDVLAAAIHDHIKNEAS
ncbi:aspartate/glutamate racemase family protein [Phaeobacter inhibens]|nr:amino acid racemase [Phaeobacter inhibens]AXT23568.1 aspartate/glutamate racemase family protein [Phaeobacter inhibens]